MNLYLIQIKKNWRKKIKGLLLGSVFLLVPYNVFAFRDIPATDPQYHIINHLQEVGVMKGFSDGHFYPDRPVSRAEAVAITMRAGGIKLDGSFTGNAYYADIDPNQWYAPWIKRGVDTKVIQGNTLNFRPQQAITKAEFLTFLLRATRVPMKRYQNTSDIALDVPKEAWFAPTFAYAKRYQVAYLPSDDFYRPQKVLTRREVAMMTYRQLKLFHGDENTKIMVEMQAAMQQFIELTRNHKYDDAEKFLPKILALNEALTRTNNDSDAFVARMMTITMEHFTESLRAFRNGKNLKGIEYLHLALKQVEKMKTHGNPKMQAFASDLKGVISETLIAFVEPQQSWYGMR